MPLTVKYSEQELDFIKENLEKLTCKQMGEHLKRHPVGVQTAIKKYLGISKPVVTTPRNKPFNHDTSVLTNQSLESYYWLGFIAADGSIFKHGRSKQYRFLIGATDKDKEHLEKFISYVSFTGAVSKIKSADFWSICFRLSDEEFNYLQSINITPNKSLTLKPPHIENHSSKLAFIKGYIDGDGCIRYDGKTKTLPHINILGTECFLKWILQSLNVNRKPSLHVNIHTVDITGKEARQVRESMLSLNTSSLARKWRPDITPVLIRRNGLPVVSDCVET